jgi:hypothetical protein
MAGCYKHLDAFMEDCASCAVLVSRPTTGDDLPSPFVADLKPVNGKLPTISTALLEKAKQVGEDRKGSEQRAREAIKGAAGHVSLLIKEVIAASGRLHVAGDDLRCDGTHKTIVIDSRTAVIMGVQTVADLSILCDLVTRALVEHIATCARAATVSAREADRAERICQGLWTVRALLDEDVPDENKTTVVQRVLYEDEFRDALLAADSSGISNAAHNLVRQQAGVQHALGDDAISQFALMLYDAWYQEGRHLPMLFEVMNHITWRYNEGGIEQVGTAGQAAGHRKGEHYVYTDRETLLNLLQYGQKNQAGWVFNTDVVGDEREYLVGLFETAVTAYSDRQKDGAEACTNGPFDYPDPFAPGRLIDDDIPF